MTLGTPLKCGWLALVLAAVLLTAFVRGELPRGAPAAARAPETGIVKVALENGEIGLLDAGGHPVPLRNYRHLAAGSTIADDLLLALAEPERIAVLTRFGREHKPEAHRYGQRPTFHGPTEIEQLKRQGVDLVVLNHLGAPAELARLRDAGIEVFNLGDMRGLATLVPNIHAVAALLGAPARGARLAEGFVRRMRAVSADVPARAQKRGLYVSAYGGQLFGGGRRSSYHDVLTAAGLFDTAAEHFEDFPHYDPEQLMLMDPEVIVTQPASVPLVCRITGLARLRACVDGGRGVIGIDDAFLGDPGLGMLPAAELLRERVYGPIARERN